MDGFCLFRHYEHYEPNKRFALCALLFAPYALHLTPHTSELCESDEALYKAGHPASLYRAKSGTSYVFCAFTAVGGPSGPASSP